MTAKGGVVGPADKSTEATDERFARHGGVRIVEKAIDLPRETVKSRVPYLGGKTIEHEKPWLLTDPPTSRRTWYRNLQKNKITK